MWKQRSIALILYLISLLGVLENSNILDETYRHKADALYAKYYPIEIDPKLNIADKLPYMKAWYKEANTALTKLNIDR